jgi:hydrogenase expression/formation protein HypC
MCLAVPGKVINIRGEDRMNRMAKVDFSGIIKEVNVSFTPEVKEGDYVIVHTGFALSVLDKEEAEKTFRYLKEIGEIE